MATQLIDIQNLGQLGMVADRPPYSLPPEAWTDLKNIRIGENHVGTILGHEGLIQCDEDMTVYYMLPFPTATEYFWVYCGIKNGNGHLCAYNGSEFRDVTPTLGITVTAIDQWSGGIFNGVPILSNGKANPPFYWPDPTGVGTKFEPLPFDSGSTWNTAGVDATVIRPFKNFLVALDVTQSSARYPHLIKWSSAADPGNIPASWDATDPTNNAGESPALAETGGYAVDLRQLGDRALVYKEDSVWSMTLAASVYVFNIRKVLSTIGALAPNCIQEFMNQHVVVGDGDIILHNGTSTQSIVSERMRSWIFNQMDVTNYRQTFLSVNHQESEMWVCFPTQGETLPNLAAIWDWVSNTWSVRELPIATSSIAYGVELPPEPLPVTDSWDGSPGTTWDDTTYRQWMERDFNPTLRTMAGCGESGVFKFDAPVNTFDGLAAQCYAERIGVPLLGHDQYGMLRRVYPQMKSTGPVNFFIASQDNPTDDPVWQGPFEFTPGADSFFNCRANGRLFGYRCESQADIQWELFGLKMEITATGRI